MPLTAPEFKAALEGLIAHQLATDVRANSGNDKIRESLECRMKFHRLLSDRNVSPPDVSHYMSLMAENANCSWDTVIFKAPMVEWCRKTMLSRNVSFSPYEPPKTVSLLLQALDHLLNNLDSSFSDLHFILATDMKYRPHGQVQKLGHDTYLIIFGCYLVADMEGLARTYYDLIARARANDVNKPFEEIFLDGSIEYALAHSLHRLQLPYFLASMFLGEKYRFAHNASPTAANNKMKERIDAFHILMIVFLLAHEFGHIRAGHLEGNSSLFSPVAWYLMEGSEFYALKDLAIDPRIVKNYQDMYFPFHQKEFIADAVACHLTMNVAVDLFHNKWPGLAAVGIVLAAISLFDRMNYLLTRGMDPATRIGLSRFNRVPFAPDLLMPISSHPWGKTRLNVLPISILTKIVPGRSLGSQEYSFITGVLTGAAGAIALTGAEAMAIVSWVIRRSGELVSVLTTKGLLTTHYPEGTNEKGLKQAFSFITQPSDLFSMREDLGINSMPDRPPPGQQNWDY
ncbi:hypothetical protein [Nitrosospira sp. Nsp13]|uniref:hypothetical protein n=1 Tax=Nitrosospira sp. Nsp13 TaxID=1855332 RepID=UPI00088F8F84|nr:hypothetical protein [Nitrosospira sp. Nsp13]SCY54229.1 hypothetical protein SAMN05216308_11641 [Nitrosospira sp. Nsp13]